MNTRILTVVSVALAALGCATSSKPIDVARPSPKAYVGLFADNAVAVVDTGSNQVVKTIAVPAGPHGVVVTPDGAKVYVSSDGAASVSVISTATDAVVGSIDVGATPHGLTISRDGKRVVCAGFGTDSVMVIDTASDTVVARVGVGRPHNSAISPDGKRAYVGSQQANAAAVVVVDLDAASVVTSVPLGHAPRALDYAPDGKVYFTQAGVDGLALLDPATNQLAPAPIATGGSPHHMIADGEYELVVSQTAGDLELVDAKTAMVEGRVPTGKAPHWIGLVGDGGRVYVTNESDNSISVIDIGSKQVVTTIAVGKGPRKIAVQPSTTTTAATAGAHAEIAATDGFAFEPAHLTVAAGTTVRWVNKGAIPHTVTSGKSSRAADAPGASFDGVLASGASFEQKFVRPGDFAYFCRYHEGMGMMGVVTVTPTAEKAAE